MMSKKMMMMSIGVFFVCLLHTSMVLAAVATDTPTASPSPTASTSPTASATVAPTPKYTGLPIVLKVSATQSTTATTTYSLSVVGLHFGASTDPIAVLVGGVACAHVTHISDTALTCLLTYSGSLYNLPVVVNAAGRISDPTVTAYRVDLPGAVVSDVTSSCTAPYGSADIITPEYCNCWSGYAPSATNVGLNTDCSQHAVCASTIVASNTAQATAPRPTTTFMNDVFHIYQQIAIIKGRRDTRLEFVVPNIPLRTPNTTIGTVGASTCSYPGVLWSKTLNQLDCFDEYHAMLPWSQHALCGFVEDASPALATATPPLRVFSSVLRIISTDTFKHTTSDTTLGFRLSVLTYKVSVSFVRQVVVVSTPKVLVVVIDNVDLRVEVTSDAMYDVASGATVVGFDTTINWPYALSTSFPLVGVFIPAAGSATLSTSVTATATSTLSDDECDTTQDTDCGQSWVLTIVTVAGAAVCDLSGTFQFNTNTLLCRDVGSAFGLCPTNSSTNFTLIFGTTDICDSNTQAVDASAGLTGVLASFYDQALQYPQTSFQTGDMLFFSLTIVDPVSTIDLATIRSVTATLAGTAVTSTVYSNGTALSGAAFNITAPASSASVPPGQPDVLYFQFRAARNILSALSALSADSAQSLVITVVVDLAYHGNDNRKREVTVLAQQVSAAAHLSVMASAEEEPEVDEDLVEQENDELVDESVFGTANTVAVGVSVCAMSLVFAALSM